MKSELFIYNLGNLADWFSAIGTVAAVFLTLYLIMDERKVRFSVVSFTQDKVKEDDSKPGVISFLAQKLLIFYGVNTGEKPKALLYQGVRIKKVFPFFRKNEVIKVTEVAGIDTSLEKNDFEMLELGNKTIERVIDFENLRKELNNQFPSKGKSIKIEFVYVDIKNKEYTDTLKFVNPMTEGPKES